MLIDLRELLSGSKDEMVVLASVDMDVFKTAYGRYEIVRKESFELTLSRISKNKITVKGNGSITLMIPCDRCLTLVSTAIDFEIDKVADIDQESEEVEEQEEQDYIDGYNLDVDELVFAEVLMNIPAKTLCRKNCKGLCPVCGCNRNEKDCGCDDQSLDPRMSVFKDILNNFKEV